MSEVLTVEHARPEASTGQWAGRVEGAGGKQEEAGGGDMRYANDEDKRDDKKVAHALTQILKKLKLAEKNVVDLLTNTEAGFIANQIEITERMIRFRNPDWAQGKREGAK